MPEQQNPTDPPIHAGSLTTQPGLGNAPPMARPIRLIPEPFVAVAGHIPPPGEPVPEPPDPLLSHMPSARRAMAEAAFLLVAFFVPVQGVNAVSEVVNGMMTSGRLSATAGAAVVVGTMVAVMVLLSVWLKQLVSSDRPGQRRRVVLAISFLWLPMLFLLFAPAIGQQPPTVGPTTRPAATSASAPASGPASSTASVPAIAANEETSKPDTDAETVAGASGAVTASDAAAEPDVAATSAVANVDALPAAVGADGATQPATMAAANGSGVSGPDTAASQSASLDAVSLIGSVLKGMCMLAVALVILSAHGQGLAQLGMDRVDWMDMPYTLMMYIGSYSTVLISAIPVAAAIFLSNDTDLAQGEVAQRIDVMRQITSTVNLLQFAMLMPLVGLYEEVLFRGYLIPRLRVGLSGLGIRWLSGWAPAALLSIAAFGAGHLYQGPYAVFQTGMLGLFYAVSFLMTRRLWPVIAAHALFNTTQFALSTHILPAL